MTVDASTYVSSAVNLVPDTEEADLRDSVRALLVAQGDIEDVRTLAASTPGFSAKVWSELTESMALTSMSVPESVGGLGFSTNYLSTALEECGRALRPEPVLLTASVGVPALVHGSASGDAAAAALLEEALAGTSVITSSPLTPRTDTVVATSDGGAWSLTGTVTAVPHASAADVFIVTADMGSQGRGLFAVRTADSVTATARESIDPTRPLASLGFDEAPAVALADSESAIADVRTRAIIGLAAESVGIADLLLELTLDYTQSRKQFDRTIASFQAIKHRLADMLLDVERARSAARYAAAHLDHDPETAALAAATAGAVACDAAHRVATEAIQLHGGIGFTWEHPAHSYYRRILTNETLFGDATAHRREIARLIGVSHATAS